jgi:hypothetical protein
LYHQLNKVMTERAGLPADNGPPHDRHNRQFSALQ